MNSINEHWNEYSRLFASKLKRLPWCLRASRRHFPTPRCTGEGCRASSQFEVKKIKSILCRKNQGKDWKCQFVCKHCLKLQLESSIISMVVDSVEEYIMYHNHITPFGLNQRCSHCGRSCDNVTLLPASGGLGGWVIATTVGGAGWACQKLTNFAQQQHHRFLPGCTS